jgi:hypothetical protein
MSRATRLSAQGLFFGTFRPHQPVRGRRVRQEKRKRDEGERNRTLSRVRRPPARHRLLCHSAMAKQYCPSSSIAGRQSLQRFMHRLPFAGLPCGPFGAGVPPGYRRRVADAGRGLSGNLAG